MFIRYSWPTRHRTLKKYKNVIVVVLILGILYVYMKWMSGTPAPGRYRKWSQQGLPTRDVKEKAFILSRTADVYMYSAFVHLPGEIDQKLDPNATDIVITTLDHSKAQLFCCILFGDKKTLQMTTSSTYYKHKNKAPTYFAHQYNCRVPAPRESMRGSYISLSSTNCSTDIQDYLPILHPTRVPGGLALCGKIAHSGGLDPEKVIEWFEVQRHLGVDKVLIYDLGNPESLNRVFRYYQNLGILDLQPYDLPGKPGNRSLEEKWMHTGQFHHDETMAALECRQRLAGYDYVIGHDLDEFIIPRKDISLKDFLKEQLHKQPNAAGFHFYTQFFITDWGPTNPEEDLMVKRYRKSTEPLWKTYKYVYLPSRVKRSTTHHFFPYASQFTMPRVSPDDAVLHHYRRCPTVNLGNCSMKTVIDNTMTRYHDLDQRVARIHGTVTLYKTTKLSLPKYDSLFAM